VNPRTSEKLITAGRTKRMRNNVVAFLEKEGEGTSIDICNYINEVMHSGTTMNQLGNLLAKDPRFKLLSHKTVSGTIKGSRYKVQNYRLSEDYKEWAYR
jgi:hypothetical protein